VDSSVEQLELPFPFEGSNGHHILPSESFWICILGQSRWPE
jgi:hypothetical protein